MRNFLMMVLLSATLAGCSGGGATVQTSSSTQGQQLIDLKAAYDKKIITEDEYDDAKEKILSGE